MNAEKQEVEELSDMKTFRDHVRTLANKLGVEEDNPKVFVEIAERGTDNESRDPDALEDLFIEGKIHSAVPLAIGRAAKTAADSYNRQTKLSAMDRLIAEREAEELLAEETDAALPKNSKLSVEPFATETLCYMLLEKEKVFGKIQEIGRKMVEADVLKRGQFKKIHDTHTELPAEAYAVLAGLWRHHKGLNPDVCDLDQLVGRKEYDSANRYEIGSLIYAPKFRGVVIDKPENKRIHAISYWREIMNIINPDGKYSTGDIFNIDKKRRAKVLGPSEKYPGKITVEAYSVHERTLLECVTMMPEDNRPGNGQIIIGR